MPGFSLIDSPMIRIHRKVKERMPDLLQQRNRWGCWKVTDPTSPFFYYQLKYDEGTGSEDRGIEIDGERYILAINNFFQGEHEQRLHDHRARFASLHFHPDLPKGTIVSKHFWNLDGGERVSVRDFTVGDIYAIEEPNKLFHRVQPVCESYTLLVGMVVDRERPPSSVHTPENLQVALKIIEDATRYFQAK